MLKKKRRKDKKIKLIKKTKKFKKLKKKKFFYFSKKIISLKNLAFNNNEN
jgi:hypothetical protein